MNQWEKRKRQQLRGVERQLGRPLTLAEIKRITWATIGGQLQPLLPRALQRELGRLLVTWERPPLG